MPTYKLSKKHRSQSKELNLKHTEDEMAYDTGSMEGSFGVRKGSWTEEEDKLLRQCIEAHGEGKWHQVPTKAGLNRCRKSCRLRWLNYLKPNIKRGKFEVDEVDLMIRLHKLLGNRWSLIAGRLPGRTANDVKNYWNTHLKKKVNSFKKSKTQQITKTKVIKPRPRSLSKTLFWSSTGQPQTPSNVQVGHQNHHHHHHRNSSSALQADDNNNNNKNEQSMWWEELLKDPEIDDQANNSTICETVVNGEEATFVGTYGESFSRDKEVDEGTLSLGAESESFWGDFFLDGDLWNFPDL